MDNRLDGPSDATADWCRRADRLLAECRADPGEAGRLARAGILLRRGWDRGNPDAPERRDLLTRLTAVQAVAQDSLVQRVRSDAEDVAELLAVVAAEAAEDEHYLAELLNDHRAPPKRIAWAVECFRDDLDWLTTQAAILGGSPGVDFLGRVLLEEEAVERQLDAWLDPGTVDMGSFPRNHHAATSNGAVRPRRRARLAEIARRLRPAAGRLREAALHRRVHGLLAEPLPDDCGGWFRLWQSAGQLLHRLEDAGQQADVQSLRHRAADGWAQCARRLEPDRRREALRHAAEELADTAGESITFLDDLPLDRSIRGLNILDEDLVRCQAAVDDSDDPGLRTVRHSLRRQRAVLAAELQEREIGGSMERRFGHRFVVFLERLILFLLVLFVVLLAAEGPLLRWEIRRNGWAEFHMHHSLVEAVLAWIDLGICAVFLGEFALKFTLARRRWLYVRRNWLTGLLPSLPIGFLAYSCHWLFVAGEAEWLVALRSLRYLRLPSMARWLRIARPAVRLARLMGFLLRASDRLVRQMMPLLNRNLVLFERATVADAEPGCRTTLAALRERVHARGEELLAELPASARLRLIERRLNDLAAMLASPAVGRSAASPAAEVAAREIPLEDVVAWLLSATPAGVSERIGRNLAKRVARWCQAMDVFIVRRLPLVRDLVAAGRLTNPYETTAVAANRLGATLSRLLERVYWLADLHGTVTAPQLVDSMGDYVVRNTRTPARRLILFGASFLAVSYLASLFTVSWLHGLSQILGRVIGTPLVVLGLLCLVFLLIGTWLRHIAGEATDFYHQVAEAQFLVATRRLKRRLAQRHRVVLDRRVLGPEAELAGAVEKTPVPFSEAVNLLWSDYLDGPPFHAGDTRTTHQLLGNLTLVSLRETRLRYRRAQRARLRRLDLSAGRMSFRGPYLWFHCISRSLAQQTAKLVLDYNAFALPLDRAATAGDGEIVRYVHWLARRQRRPLGEVALPEVFRLRAGAIGPQAIARDRQRRLAGREFQGNEFTAIHFLSTDEALLNDVRRRYGDEVAELVHRDRRDNVRRVFRTYPLHRWPKEQRTINPWVFYQRHMVGGLVLLVPLKAAWWGLRFGGRVVRLAARQVRDVLEPTRADLPPLAECDPFDVAVRKIHRMRRPLVLECLRMRAEFDPEYLGLLLPGSGGAARGGACADVEADLKRAGADPRLAAEIRRLTALRRRQVLEFRRWLDRWDQRAVRGESLRAMAIAYAIDYRGVRTRLEAARRLQRAFDEAWEERSGAAARGGPPARVGRRLDRLFEQPSFSQYGGEPRAECVRLLRRRGPLRLALRQLTDLAPAAMDPVAEAREMLLAVGRDPATWSRQLVVLRAVQTLCLLDLETYCDLVAELGEYAEEKAGNGAGFRSSRHSPRRPLE